MPYEILFDITSASNLDFKSLHALTLTSRFLHSALNGVLYKRELASGRKVASRFPYNTLPTAFDYAIDHALEGTLNNLIRYGFNIDAPLSRQHRMAHLYLAFPSLVTPLFATIVDGRGQALQMLLRCGARVDVADAQGFAALHVAAGWGQWGLIRDLVAAGADLEARTVKGLTPLWMAMDPGIWGVCDLRTVRELVAMGADVNAVNRNGDTLQAATATGFSEEVERFLLEAGADSQD